MVPDLIISQGKNVLEISAKAVNFRDIFMI